MYLWQWWVPANLQTFENPDKRWLPRISWTPYITKIQLLASCALLLLLWSCKSSKKTGEYIDFWPTQCTTTRTVQEMTEGRLQNVLQEVYVTYDCCAHKFDSLPVTPAFLGRYEKCTDKTVPPTCSNVVEKLEENIQAGFSVQDLVDSLKAWATNLPSGEAFSGFPVNGKAYFSMNNPAEFQDTWTTGLESLWTWMEDLFAEKETERTIWPELDTTALVDEDPLYLTLVRWEVDIFRSTMDISYSTLGMVVYAWKAGCSDWENARWEEYNAFLNEYEKMTQFIANTRKACKDFWDQITPQLAITEAEIKENLNDVEGYYMTFTCASVAQSEPDPEKVEENPEFPCELKWDIITCDEAYDYSIISVMWGVVKAGSKSAWEQFSIRQILEESNTNDGVYQIVITLPQYATQKTFRYVYTR